MEDVQEAVNDGATTSSAALAQKQEKKKNLPWIEKYRPQIFEEIMGKKILNFTHQTKLPNCLSF